MELIVDYLATVVFSVLLLLVTVSTIYDAFTRKRNYEPKKIYIAFSLLTNVQELLKLEPKSTKSIECFNGLRGLSAFWVIAGHRIVKHDRMVKQAMKINNGFSQMIVAVLMTNGYAVDTFFLISGVLIAQSCLKALDANRLNLMKIYLNRYLRYIPTVAVLLLFYMSSLPFVLVDGLSIPYLRNQVKHCHDYWWSALLLLQNYVNVTSVCMGPTWYLSADFHLFLMSPFFIYLLWKFKNNVLWLFVAIIVSTQTTIFFGRYFGTVHKDLIYLQTHFRIAQFLVGIALGYIMYTREGKNFMRKRLKVVGWIISLGFLAAFEIYHETHKGQRFAEAFYIAVQRIAWAILIAWIVFVCHHLRSGGIINWFLSHQLWQPIARISLSIYLVHDMYIAMTIANMKELWYLEPSWLFHIVIGDITVSTLLGAALYLFIEAPSGLVVKYFL